MTTKWVVFSPSRCSYIGWALAVGSGGWRFQPCRSSTQTFDTRTAAEELAAAIGDGEVLVHQPSPHIPEPADPTYW